MRRTKRIDKKLKLTDDFEAAVSAEDLVALSTDADARVDTGSVRLNVADVENTVADFLVRRKRAAIASDPIQIDSLLRSSEDAAHFSRSADWDAENVVAGHISSGVVAAQGSVRVNIVLFNVATAIQRLDDDLETLFREAGLIASRAAVGSLVGLTERKKSLKRMNSADGCGSWVPG